MSIAYDHSIRVFTLHTRHTTYQMQVNPLGQLLHLYYGDRFDAGNAAHLIGDSGAIFCPEPGELSLGERGYAANILPQEYPAAGTGDYRPVCLRASFADGGGSVALRYVSHTVRRGKPPLEGLPGLYFDDEEVDSLLVTMADAVTGLRVELQYAVAEAYDVVTRSARIVNDTGTSLYLEAALSCCLEFLTADYHLIRFLGRPLMERQMVRTPLTQGEMVAGSRFGVSSHQANPFAILCAPQATETGGDCYGVSLLYSGSFVINAAVDMFDQTRLTIGIHPEGFRYRLAPGEAFQTPEAVLCYSNEGLGLLSRRYHRVFREHLCRGRYRDGPRPLLVNSWEAVLYDFDAERLLAIADQAAEVGIELLVIDDGWFGKRDDDQSSLGDWVVNEAKLKQPLRYLSDRLHAKGMKLGLWFEPEMVSEDSDLYRHHPDWCLHVPGRPPCRGRNQLVLDMSRDEVVDYLRQAMSAILVEGGIDYVKWDMNRPLTDIWSAALPADLQGEVAHRYVLGVYRLLESMVTAFPHILFEGCASGGGRFDAGMLYYTPQIWCSDNSDAMDRLLIQYNTSFGYPVSCMGSHVSPCPNHQVGRTTPLKTRSVVAMAGTFGYEMDLCTLTGEEKALVRAQVAAYKRYAAVIRQGDYYRLTDPYKDGPVAWQFVSPDRRVSLVGCVLRLVKPNARPVLFRLQGLDPLGQYRLVIDGEEQAKPLSGETLMKAGLVREYIKEDYVGCLIELTRVGEVTPK